MHSPLLYHDGERWRDYHCYNSYTRSKGIFVGLGPSLGKIDTSKLTGPGKTVVGVNNTYPAVRPDIWVGVDDPHCYHRHVLHEGFIKILRGGYQNRECEGVSVMEMPNTYFVNTKKADFYVDLFKHIGPDSNFTVWHANVFSTTINLMIYMGFKEIYLAGVDFDNSERQYFNDTEYPDDQRARSADLYKTLYGYLEFLVSVEDKLGVKFYSISPDSPINKIVQYVSLDELNDSIELPKLGPLYHCMETK